MDIGLKINQPRLNAHKNGEEGLRDSSYFYEGLIAETKNYELHATGEIQTVNNQVYYNDGEVNRAYIDDSFKLNNWFEIIPKAKDVESFFPNGESYPEALLELIETEQAHTEEPRQLSIDIYYSEGNNGYMYNVYDTVSDNQKDSGDSIDGGLCTGTIHDALNMAYESAKQQLEKSSDENPNRCFACGKCYSNSDVDLLQDDSTICHNCKNDKGLMLNSL